MPFTISIYSLAGLLIMGGAGLVLLGLYQRWIYPAQRQRHEAAKLTGAQRRDPNVFKVLIKTLTLLVLPALGFILGHSFLAPIGG